ncbi:hypothetical protein ACEWY4_017283 [Coilia grayii]|uniref:Immunoglobulin domain-containing protein n=1 Tax=Coilia grayii TaxID=363190 RepID=A0ABD1JGE5_9TELE
MTFHWKKIFFFFSVKAQNAIRVNAFNKGGLLIFCKYSDEYREMHKYLCKGQVSTCLYNQLNHSNDRRFVQYENSNRAYLTILVKNLTSHDKGIYHCATEDEKIHVSFNVTIKEGDYSDIPIAISAHGGEHINIPCKYPKEFERNIKHFCKEHTNFIESDLIESKPSSIIEKYSVSENKSANTVTVTIHDLRRKDAGIYWCGIRTGGKNVALTTQVELQITGSLMEVKGFARGGVAIVCKFSHQDQLKQRFFCKGDASTCPYNQLSNTNDSRVVIYTCHHGDVLTILMTNLTLEDAGTYHCVENGEPHTKVQLSIEDGDCCGPPIRIIANEGDNITIQCTYPVEFRNNIKHFCREREGKVHLDLLEYRPPHSDLKYLAFEKKGENLFNVTIYNVRGYDTAVYWCGVRSGRNNVALFAKVELKVLEKARSQYKKTIACVVTALLLAAAFFLCHRRRLKRMHGRFSDPIYEEIDDINLAPFPGVSSTAVYSTIDNPNSNPNFQTAIHTVYASAELPTIPCEVATYVNIPSPTQSAGDTNLSLGTASTFYAVSPDYANSEPSVSAARLGTTTSVNQESTNLSEDNVCETPDRPTHTSDENLYVLASDPASAEINTVYVTAQFTADTSDYVTAQFTADTRDVSADPEVLFSTNSTDDLKVRTALLPSDPYYDSTPFSVHEQTTHPENSHHCTPSDTETNTNDIPSNTNNDPIYPNANISSDHDDEHMHDNVQTSTDDLTVTPSHLSTNHTDHIDHTEGTQSQGSTQPND